MIVQLCVAVSEWVPGETCGRERLRGRLDNDDNNDDNDDDDDNNYEDDDDDNNYMMMMMTMRKMIMTRSDSVPV